MLEPAAPVGHGGFKHLMADGEQQIAGGHAAEHRLLDPVGSLHGLTEIQRGGAVDSHPTAFEDPGEVVELLVRLVRHVSRIGAILAQGIVLLWPVPLDCDLRGLHHRPVGPPDDDVLQGIPLVPRAHNRFRMTTGHHDTSWSEWHAPYRLEGASQCLTE